MASSAETDYAAFEKKVKRTVYIDNLSPLVTEPVLKFALGQFGTVTNVQFIPNYLEPKKIPHCALVEMENAKQAEGVIMEMSNFPFMMAGMPRPVRARAAEAEMFGERPVKPGRQICCRWLDQNDHDYEVAQKLKRVTQKHAAEASFLLKQQLEEEEKLAEQQAKILKANNKKYEMMDNVTFDGTAYRLACYYGMNVTGNR